MTASNIEIELASSLVEDSGSILSSSDCMRSLQYTVVQHYTVCIALTHALNYTYAVGWEPWVPYIGQVSMRVTCCCVQKWEHFSCCVKSSHLCAATHFFIIWHHPCFFVRLEVLLC
jgi:hypothetical protein